MFVGMALYRQHRELASEVTRTNERGAAIVEWLGISALSVGLLVVIFQGMTLIGLDLVDSIRSQLGL